jgi:endonuclease-3
MSKSKSRTKKPPIEELMARFKAANPDPRCELYYKTPYQLLVSVVLSAQMTDKGVNKVMQPLYDAGDFTPETVVGWGDAALLAKIKSIGLAPTKARNVVKLSHMLLDLHGGEVPRDREALEAMPGVGRKTANVVLSELWREPHLAVDTHVFRVGARLGLHAEATAAKAEQALLEVIDAKYLPAAHHWLILHGRYTCKALNPQCDDCIVSDLCPSAKAAKAAPKGRSRARAKP